MSQVYWQPGMKLADVEKMVIERALIFAQGNLSKTAEMLGVTRGTIRNKIEMYKIQLDCLKKEMPEATPAEVTT